MTEANKPKDPGNASGGRIGELLDLLFSEEGIAIPGDGTVLDLVALGEHTLKYHKMADPQQRLSTPVKGGPSEFFEGGEHTAIGDSVTLYFSGSDSGSPAWSVPLHLPNDLQLTYGQVVALGGDFYGIPDKPISDGATAGDRIKRFSAAFDSLATLPASKAEAGEILAVMQEEIKAANQAILDGVQPHVAYDKLDDDLSKKWNRITGGGYLIPPWIPMGRYLKLAATNWDHFGDWAVLAYKAGHAAALNQAVKAHGTKQRKDLELAYAMNAFADHFLSDLFSGGHLRTPRKQLYEKVTPSDIGSLLSRSMHDEDCKFGLNVFNAMDENWHAYGDKRYFDTVDVANRNNVNTVVQTSVDEIFETYMNGSAPSEGQYQALLYVPDLKQVQNHLSTANYSALFVAQNNTVLRRQDINNLNDRNWTDNWWGSTTLALLTNDYHPKPPAGYLNPPTQAPTIQANGWQSHTPSPPNWVDGNAVRYAYSFTNGLNESYTGPWSAFVTLEGSYHPSVTVPLDTSGKSTARNVFRQFEGKAPTLVGSVANGESTFIDQQN